MERPSQEREAARPPDPAVGNDDEEGTGRSADDPNEVPDDEEVEDMTGVPAESEVLSDI